MFKETCNRLEEPIVIKENLQSFQENMPLFVQLFKWSLQQSLRSLDILAVVSRDALIQKKWNVNVKCHFASNMATVDSFFINLSHLARLVEIFLTSGGSHCKYAIYIQELCQIFKSIMGTFD